MSNDLVPITFSELTSLANAVAGSKLFGIKTPQEALALMAIAQAEGLHPAIAARDYHVIQGRPTLKADAMLSRFQASGGKVDWLKYSDECCEATFSHPQGGSVTVMWDMARVKKAEISNANMYRKYPRNMLRSRCISEGVHTVYPGVSVGFYTPEEGIDEIQEPIQPPKKVETLEAQFTEVTPEQNHDDLKEKAKIFAEASEIAPSIELLDKLVHDNKAVSDRLESELPAWNKKLIAKIEQRRAYLSQPKDQLEQILDEMPEPPDFLKRSHLEAAE